MFCVSVTLFSPLFHYKELALREDVYTKRLHPSRLLGVHSGVIDIVNQRRHTSDKPIGGVNKLTITAQWVSFPLLFMSIRFIHLCLHKHYRSSPLSAFMLSQTSMPYFYRLIPSFYLKKKNACVRRKYSVLLGSESNKKQKN